MEELSFVRHLDNGGVVIIRATAPPLRCLSGLMVRRPPGQRLARVPTPLSPWWNPGNPTFTMVEPREPRFHHGGTQGTPLSPWWNPAFPVVEPREPRFPRGGTPLSPVGEPREPRFPRGGTPLSPVVEPRELRFPRGGTPETPLSPWWNPGNPAFPV